MAETSHTLALNEIFEKKNTDVLENEGNVPINSRTVRQNFSKVVKAAESNKYRIIVTDHGEPKAGIVSVDDLRIINWLEKLKIKDDLQGLAYKDVSTHELLALLRSMKE